MLLCSHHHKLLHEGGFKIRRDASGDTYFQRPDGRAIPRHGYRLEDQCDDVAEDAGFAEDADAIVVQNDSAESWMAQEPGRDFFSGVRETHAVYQLRSRQFLEAGAA
jgi:hypothetical protein